MNIAVLGGFGLMAEAALHDLACQRRVVKVLAADLSLARAQSVLARIPKRAKVVPVQLDLTDTASAARKLKGCDVILNCSWYEHNLAAMDLALALKAHYVDLGGLYHTTLRQLEKDAAFKRAGLLGALGCGSTPGITNMMAARMADTFESIDTVGIYDACHDPSISDDTFLPPFSIRTMLAEYVQPAPVFLEGRIKEVSAHSDDEELEFNAPIGRVRAGIVIHSETATLPGYLKSKKVQNLFFKIAYPESVKRQLAMLVGMGLGDDAPVRVDGSLISPRHFVTALAQRSAAELPASKPRDFEVLRVKISGRRHKLPLVKTWDCEIRHTSLLSAGALGVGFAGSIAATMLAERKSYVQAGVGAPEAMLDANIFFRELKSRKSFSLIETIAHPLAI